MHPFLSAAIPRVQHISRKGGTRRMAQIPSWHMSGRPLCLLAGCSADGSHLVRCPQGGECCVSFACRRGNSLWEPVSAAFYHPDFVC